MAEPATLNPKPAEILKGLDDRLKEQGEQIKTLVSGLAERDKAFEAQARDLGDLKTKAANAPDYAVAGIVGGIPKDSECYSVLKAAALTRGWLTPEQAKYETDVSNKLGTLYKGIGWTNETSVANMARRVFVPFSTGLLPRVDSESERMVGELKYKMVAGAEKVDPDEAGWIQKRTNGHIVTKDLGTLSEAAGGVLVGFPTLGELVDLQRNIEVFASAGATEQSLPPNGRLQIPKLTGPTTAFWVGEGAVITESTPATGALDLQAKKLGIFLDLNNELIRFASITAEAMARTDMAKVAALKMDLASLEGTGGTQIKGLTTYTTAASWTTGTDPLLAYTVTANLFQISDAADMEALLPDTAGTPTAWVMRRNMWAKIRNRRASAAITTDLQGPFLTGLTRSAAQDIPLQFEGTKVVRSTQVSNTRGTGAQTYVILGYFPDWIIARFGALEFLSSMVGDTQMTNDQTRIRCIQHVDAGARHASSFVIADAITIS